MKMFREVEPSARRGEVIQERVLDSFHGTSPSPIRRLSGVCVMDHRLDLQQERKRINRKMSRSAA